MVGNFLKGLGCLFGGFVVWVLASFVGALGEIATGTIDPFFYGLMVLGYFVMIVGPIVFWVVFPIKNRLIKKESVIRILGPSQPFFCKFCVTRLLPTDNYGPQCRRPVDYSEMIKLRQKR